MAHLHDSGASRRIQHRRSNRPKTTACPPRISPHALFLPWSRNSDTRIPMRIAARIWLVGLVADCHAPAELPESHIPQEVLAFGQGAELVPGFLFRKSETSKPARTRDTNPRPPRRCAFR